MSRIASALKKMVVKPDTDYLAELGDLESKAYLIEPSQLRERTIARANASGNGLCLPFDGIPLVKQAPGRWTLVSGTTHSGKTQLLRFMMLNAMLGSLHPQYGNTPAVPESVMFCSLEEEPEEVLLEFIHLCWAVRPKLTTKMIDWVCDLLEGRLWIFNHTGFIEPNVAIGAVAYGAKHLGVKNGVIDSLMRLKMRKDDWDGQREIGDTLGRVARQYQIHINFVAHPNKRGSEHDVMGMYDVGGAQELVGQADSIILLQRTPHNDKLRKEWDVQEGAHALLQVPKQRGAWNLTGRLELGYLHDARQWTTQIGGKIPRYFLPDEAYQEAGIRIHRPSRVTDMFDINK